MNRITPWAVSALLASFASAQCFESDFGSPCPRAGFPGGVGDDVLFDLQPLPFAFPMGGVAASYSHVHIQSNGVAFLTTGAVSGETTTGYATNAATQLANLRGTAGSPPRIAPFWRDLNLLPGNGGAAYYNDTLPGKVVITWANAVQFGTTSPVFTVQAQLFADGSVSFFYDAATGSGQPVITGVSAGNGIASAPAADLSAGGNSSTTLWLHERFAGGAFDLAGQCVWLAPNAGGYVQLGSAQHEPYGAGCYELPRETFFQYFADAAAAAAALAGQSMVLTPAADGYAAAWGGGSYITPGAGIVLPLGDDTSVVVVPSLAMPTPFGSFADLRVHSNGIVTLGATAQDFPGAPNVYTPTPSSLINASRTAFWSWHDYNPAEVGSGPVRYEETTVGADTVALITWDDVENWSSPAAVNRSTMQFQLNLSTGVVTLVWLDIDADASSTFGSAHLVGFSPGGPSLAPMAIDLASALPLTTEPDGGALQLSASPAPVSTATTGTLVTYTTSNIPEAAPGSGIYLAANILSVAGVPVPGVELSFLVAPGCYAHVLTIGAIEAMVGGTDTLTVAFVVPPGVAPGFTLYSQSVALFVPGTLPNGQNGAGMTTSNGVRSTISRF